MSETPKPEPENNADQQDAAQEQQEQPSGGQEQQPAPEPPDDPSLLPEEDTAESSEDENGGEPESGSPSDVSDDHPAAKQDSGTAEDAEAAADGADEDAAKQPAEDTGTPSSEESTEGGEKESGASDKDASGDGGDDGDDQEDEEDGELPEPMSFLDHMTELRIRLVRCLIAAGVGFLACYGFHNELFALLMEPLVNVFPPGSSLIYTGLPEAFFTYIKVSMVAGVLLTSPYIFYQLWCFIAPGLYKDEKKYLIPIAFFSGVFFAVGAIFGYSVVFPFAFGFFMEFATETIKPMPSLKEYLSFSLKLLFAFGLTFELPLFAFFLGKLGIINAPMLRRIRKYAFLAAFVVAAVLTPPDIISQILMAGPLIILFEISIWVVQIFGRQQPKKEEEEEEEDEEEAEEDTDAAEKETAKTETE